MFLIRKKEVKTYSFEDMEEMATIKGLVTSCNTPIRSDADTLYLTRRLEKIVKTQERWENFIKRNPEMEMIMMMDFNELELTKHLVTFKLENNRV